MTHKAEIIQSRLGGFGGSDARMFLKVGRKGIESLSETDKKRLAVMMGQIPYQETFTTKHMMAGNEFEAWLFENKFTKEHNYKSNERIYSDKKYNNFIIFAHPDFARYFKSRLFVIEFTCKLILK